MKHGIFFILIFVIILYIQTILSSQKNKYLGLALPALAFISSFAWVVFMIASGNGNVGKAFFTLVIMNIPTYIMLLIYRHKRKPPKAPKIKREL